MSEIIPCSVKKHDGSGIELYVANQHKQCQLRSRLLSIEEVKQVVDDVGRTQSLWRDGLASLNEAYRRLKEISERK